MKDNPLDALPEPSSYPRTSRYYETPTAVWHSPDGREVTYLRRRLLPDPDGLTVLGEHVVSEGDRLDLLADHYFGDAGQWWRIADANPSIDPGELTATPGRRIRITLPEGVAGPAVAGPEME